MAIANKNQIPIEFKRFHQSFLDLKTLLKSKAVELPAERTVPVLMVCHYGTFVLNSLYKSLGRDSSKLYEVRSLIELMLAHEAFEVAVEHRIQLLSFVDNMGKSLTVAKKPYIHIAMYNGHLDSEIYRLLHQDLGIYDFARYLYINPVTVNQMKQVHDASVALLNELQLPINRPIVCNTLKINV